MNLATSITVKVESDGWETICIETGGAAEQQILVIALREYTEKKHSNEAHEKAAKELYYRINAAYCRQKNDSLTF